MNLNVIRPKNERKYLIISIIKNCETLIKQTDTKPQVTLDFKLTQPRKTFQFNPPFSIEGSWMLGLTSLELDNCIFNITEEITNSNFIQALLTSFLLQNWKRSLRRSLIFQILHPSIYRKNNWTTYNFSVKKTRNWKETDWWLLHVINGLWLISISRFWNIS